MMSKTIQKNSKYKLPKIINVLNENDAKHLVRTLKMKGYNNRDILKIKIMIDDEKFPLNIPKIEEIYKLKQNLKGKTEFTDADFFKLYQQGFTPNDVVSILKCTFDEADKAFEKFQKYSGMTLTSLEELNTLYSHLHKIDPSVQTLADAAEVVKTAVESHLMLQKYTYRCDVCEDPMVIGTGELSSILQHLKDKFFGHDYCHEDNY